MPTQPADHPFSGQHVSLLGRLSVFSRRDARQLVERLGGDAQYQSMQQFLADSPWDPALVVRAVAERVAPEIGVRRFVV